VQAREAGRHAELLVRAAGPAFPPSGWEISGVTLEELVLAYLRDPSESVPPEPWALPADARRELTR
jgi:ABC-2 type transport system ATP-binding protein